MSDKLSIEQITIIMFSFFLLMISYYFYKIGIWYSPVQKKYIYNWPVIYASLVFGITGFGLIGMTIYK